MTSARKFVMPVLVLVTLIGIPIVAAAQTPAKPTPTFTKDVAPILQQKCQVCHRPDSMAPMSLLTYEDARPWARSMRNKVVNREMPPWYIDRTVGITSFKNDISLSNEEIDTIARWVDGDAPRGNLADMPPPRHFDDFAKWHIGQPDLIVTLPKDIVVPPQGPDRWVDVLVDAGLTEDRYLQAVETKPSKGFRVVHHSVQTMHEADDMEPGTGGLFLNEYALGKNGDVFPDGAGRLIKAGTRINFNLHLHSIGEAIPANVEVGLKFYPKGYVPAHIETTTTVGNSGEKDLDLPPNTDNVRTDGFTVLTQPVRLLSFQPHMHNRGKAMCVEAIYPPSATPPDPRAAAFTPTSVAVPKVETLSCVDKYQFAWHIVYLYDEDTQPLLPAGTILHTIGYHNNTATNRFNPDPDALVTYGQRTIDDMSFAWMSWYPLSPEEYQQQVKERDEKNKAKRSQQHQQ